MGRGVWMPQQGIEHLCFAAQVAAWGSSCVWVEMLRREGIVFLEEEESFYVWGIWRDVAW